MTSRRACVIGHPVAHARSPLIHRYWLAEHKIDGDYAREDVPPEKIEAFFADFPSERICRREHHAAAQGSRLSRAGPRRAGCGDAQGCKRNLARERDASSAQTPTFTGSSPISTKRALAGILEAEQAVVLGAGGCCARCHLWLASARRRPRCRDQPDGRACGCDCRGTRKPRHRGHFSTNCLSGSRMRTFSSTRRSSA